MEAVDAVVRPLQDFAKDSVRLVKRCHKPDRKGCCGSFLESDVMDGSLLKPRPFKKGSNFC